MKCDESKPSCKQCLRRSKKCPGYLRPLCWSTKYEKLGIGSSCSKSPQPRTPSPSPIDAEYRFTNAGAEDQASWSTSSRTAITGPQETPSPRISSKGRPLNSLESADDSLMQDIITACLQNGYSASALKPAAFEEWPQDLLSGVCCPAQVFSKSVRPLASHSAPKEGIGKNSGDFDTTDKSQPKISEIACITGNSSSFMHADLPTMLIERWFSCVSRVHYAYNSEANIDRKMAWSMWSTSEAVYYALQSMSASFLANAKPSSEFRLPFLLGKALSTIKQGLAEFYILQRYANASIPTDIIFAAFAVGTSLCWSRTTDLGLPLRENIARVLDLCSFDDGQLGLRERAYYVHFCKSLNYWDMLVSITPNRRTKELLLSRKYQEQILSATCDIRQTTAACRLSLSSADSSPQPFVNRFKSLDHFPPLHTWAGISSHVQNMLGLTLSLCRDELENGSQIALAWPLPELSRDISNLTLARRFLCELQRMNFGSLEFLGSSPIHKFASTRTEDEQTPVWHLICAAEAARLAAILHLHLNFSGLTLSGQHKIEENTGIHGEEGFACADACMHTQLRREEKATDLSIELLNVLLKIPTDSGSSKIQPLLYVCAAAGLLLPKVPPSFQDSSLMQDLRTNSKECGIFGSIAGATSHFASFCPLPGVAHGHPREGEETIESAYKAQHAMGRMARVKNARQTIIDRLQSYRSSGAPQQSGKALELVSATWSAYDTRRQGLSGSHWITIMHDMGHLTLFG